MNKKPLSRVEQLKKEKENNYMRFVIIVCLAIFIIIGKVNVLTTEEPLSNSFVMPKKGNFNTFKDNVLHYSMNVNKRNIKNLDKEIGNLVTKINNNKNKLSQYQTEERQLSNLIANKPVELYEHNKLDLIAYMIEILKNEDLVYEVNYNYTGEVEDEEEEQEQTVEVTQLEDTEEVEPEYVDDMYTNKDLFAISIYQLDSDNYQKVINFLDQIFIKEAYSIDNVKIDYDKVSKSYYLELIIGI